MSWTGRIIAESPASPPGPNNHPSSTDIIEEPQMEIDSKNEPEICQPTTADRLEVLSKVEAILESVIDSLLQKQKKIQVPINVKKQPPKLNTSSSSRSFTTSAWTRVFVNFPGRDSREVFKFAVLWRILGLVQEALTKGIIVSKRNIFYKDPALFKSQSVVDRYIDILAYTLDVQRAALNVTAAAKGLVAGSFAVTRRSGIVGWEISHLATSLIDEVDDIISIDTSGVAWVLVVEKESTFRTLASSRFYNTSQAGKGIIMTGKGYPDLSTRAFLYLLSISRIPEQSPAPIYALVDFDPDGINIMSTYRHGSWNLSHEDQYHNVPSICWLGPKSEDILFNNGDSEKCESEMFSDGEGVELLRLSLRDRRRAVGMMKRNDLKGSGQDKEWRRELQVMLMLGLKAEMELLGNRKKGLEAWVERKLITTGLRKDISSPGVEFETTK